MGIEGHVTDSAIDYSLCWEHSQYCVESPTSVAFKILLLQTFNQHDIVNNFISNMIHCGCAPLER